VKSLVSEGPTFSFRIHSVHPRYVTMQTKVTPQPRQRKLQITEGQNAPSVLRNVSVPDHLLTADSYHFAYKRRFSIPPTEAMGNTFLPCQGISFLPTSVPMETSIHSSVRSYRITFHAYCLAAFNKYVFNIYNFLFQSTTLNFYISVYTPLCQSLSVALCKKYTCNGINSTKSAASGTDNARQLRQSQVSRMHAVVCAQISVFLLPERLRCH
jgi:hypothetical protein